MLFFQGCPHACPGCQNPDTWDPAGGEEFPAAGVVEKILGERYIDGVTFSGGDPFYQAEAAAEIARALRKRDIPVWAYTGWTYEELMAGAAGQAAGDLLAEIEVLVDGPFVLEQLSEDCIYRGSTNQRLIDVRKSLSAGQAVLWEES